MSIPSISRCISPCSRPLKRPTLWSSYHLGLKRGTPLATSLEVKFRLGLERQRVQGADPRTEQRAPTQEPSHPNRNVKWPWCPVSCLSWLAVRVSFPGSGPWLSFPVPVCFLSVFFFLLLFLSFGRGRHVPAPGWEGRRVKREGTDPRNGTGRRPKDWVFQVLLCVRLSCVPRRACLVLCLPL